MLGIAQALRTEGSDQENYTLRSQYVLLENATRDEAVEIFQSREHHIDSRHPEATKLRNILGSLPHPGAYGDRHAPSHQDAGAV